MISVIIPLRDAGPVLEEQLQALANQTYQGAWELIIADNASADEGLSVATRWQSRIPQMRIVDASSCIGGAAVRNMAAEIAIGDLLLFCDADDVADIHWLEAMASALSEHDFVTGALDNFTLNAGVTEFRPQTTTAPFPGWLPYAPTANIGVSRKAFDAVKGFDAELWRAGADADFSFRVQLAGYPLTFEPNAKVAYRHRRTLRGLWDQWFAYGVIWPELYRRFRAKGMPRARLRWLAYVYVGLVLQIPGALLSRERRVKWIRRAAYMWGRIRGSIRERVFFP